AGIAAPVPAIRQAGAHQSRIRRLLRQGEGAVGRPARLMPARGHVLPDVLAPNLKIIFCGSAAGTASALARAYYAKAGNKFWPTLAATGLTPQRIAPHDYPRVIEFGIGLTDMCKTEFGQDEALTGEGDDARAVLRKVRYFKPHVLAFNGK